MTATEVEKRLTALEAEVARLKSSKKTPNPWWDKIAGVFANDPLFEEAMRLGREAPDPMDAKVTNGKRRASGKRKAGK